MTSIAHTFEIARNSDTHRYDVRVNGQLIDSTRTDAEAQYQIDLFTFLQQRSMRELVCDSSLDEQHERSDTRELVWKCPVEVKPTFEAAYRRIREIAGGLLFTLITDNVRNDRAQQFPDERLKELDAADTRYVNLLARERIIFATPLVVYHHGCILQLYTTRLDGRIGQLRYEVRHWPEIDA